MWIADSADGMLYAYTLAGGARDSSKDITLDSANSSPVGIWSNGTTIWVARVAPSAQENLCLHPGRRQPRFGQRHHYAKQQQRTSWGVWSDGTTMWVADWNDDKLYAYTLADNTRDSSKEFDLNSDNTSPRGIWSDGSSIWVADKDDKKLYAYDLASGDRVEGHDISLHSSNESDSAGIWGKRRHRMGGERLHRGR